MNELINDAYRLWRSIGPLSPLADFQALEQQTAQGRPYLLLMVDMTGVGRKESMTARVHRTLYPHQSDHLEEELRALHHDLETAIRRSSIIGVRF
jgi:hypothetical protein